MRYLLCAALLAAIFSLGEPARAAGSGTMPNCGFNDPVVWVNTSTKVYHLKGDPYYGNTKHGQYECKSAADSSGNHLSKQKGEGTTPGPAQPAAPAPSPVATASSKHHHKKTGASPMPSASAMSPAVPSPSPAGSKHHHHKSSGAKATPSPAAT
jgi:hypothetical protein